MKLKDIVNEILVRTGQYIVASDYTQLNELQLDMDKLWHLVDRELKDYEKYKPITRRFNITTSSWTTPFADDSHNAGNGPPVWFSHVIPVGFGLTSATMLAMLSPLNVRNNWSLNRLITPSMVLWSYWTDWVDPQGAHSGPIFVSSMVGMFDITAHYHYARSITRDANKKILDVDIPELDDHALPCFFDMLSARFIVAVGRSRRAFTYNDLPVTTDAPLLVSEGEKNYEEARKTLYDRNEWWLGVTT